MKIKLFKKKQCWKPTFLMWFLFLVFLILIVFLWITNVYRFLTVQKIIPAKIMVIEGWVDDNVLQSALTYYKKHAFEHMIVTGLPITSRHLFSNYQNTAQLAIAQLHILGFKDTIYSATLPRGITINRTYNTAIATKIIFEQHPQWDKKLLIFSEGVHSRRTKRMFDIAFGKKYKIGIIAGKEKEFDPAHFWHTSKGFRTVSNEFTAYLWVYFFYHPNSKKYEQQLLQKKKNINNFAL